MKKISLVLTILFLIPFIIACGVSEQMTIENLNVKINDDTFNDESIESDETYLTVAERLELPLKELNTIQGFICGWPMGDECQGTIRVKIIESFTDTEITRTTVEIIDAAKNSNNDSRIEIGKTLEVLEYYYYTDESKEEITWVRSINTYSFKFMPLVEEQEYILGIIKYEGEYYVKGVTPLFEIDDNHIYRTAKGMQELGQYFPEQFDIEMNLTTFEQVKENNK